MRSKISICVLLVLGGLASGRGASSAQDEPQPVVTPREVFVSALEEFQGIGRDTFQEHLVAFVDRWLTKDRGSSADRARAHRTAVLLGLGALFDAGDTLRNTPIVGSMLKGIATEEEKRTRDRICSHARLHGRHDAPKHFFLAAALTTRGGPAAATQAGLVKEFEDARRFDATPPSGSGFSFLDLAYDHAGVRFAAALLGWRAQEKLTAPPLPVSAFLPEFPTLSLPERIGWQQYQDEYRGAKSEAILDRIHAAIDSEIARASKPAPGDGSDSAEDQNGKPGENGKPEESDRPRSEI